MPYKRSTRVARKPKRAFRKKVRKTRSRTTVTLRSTQPIAPRCIAKLKYAETYQNSIAGSAIPGVYLFNLNSIFDPDRSGTGHQPYGHDTFATLYNKYRVFAVSWRVVFPASVSAYQAVVLPANHAAGIANIDEAIEQPRAILKQVSTTGPQTFTGRISLAHLHGNTPAQYKANESCASSMGGSPTEVMTLKICTANVYPASAAQVVYPTCTMIFHTEFFDPIDLAQS